MSKSVWLKEWQVKQQYPVIHQIFWEKPGYAFFRSQLQLVRDKAKQKELRTPFSKNN